jgi:Protein of unknown function (DUF3037)
MTDLQPCNFFVLRYVPDAVKNEFVNIGLVLLPQAGSAELRFTRDWSRVKCLDPEADLEALEAVEADLRDKLRALNGDRDFILRKIQDSFSNALQPSEFTACAAAQSPAEEADLLARIYLESEKRRQPREVSTRQAVYQGMRREFESVGVWRAIPQPIVVANYTRRGDPLRVDCGYPANGTFKMFHALGLPGDVNGAKLLAFTFPELAAGIRAKEGKQAQLTAIVDDNLDRGDDHVGFALETLARQQIRVAPLAEMPAIAAQAAREIGIV